MFYKFKSYYAYTLLTIIALQGCASSVIHEQKQSIKSVQAYETTQTFNAPTIEWPSTTWWKIYGDDQLTALITKALMQSPTLAVINARVEQMQSNVAFSQANLLPQIGANATFSSEKLSYNHITPSAMLPKGWNDYGLTTLNISWEMDFWGKHKAAIRTAISELEAMHAEQTHAQLLLSSMIATVYVQLGEYYSLKESLKESVQIQEKILLLIQERYQNGLEHKANVSEARMRYTNSLNDLQRMEEAIKLTQNQLAALIGEGPDSGQTIKRPTIQIDIEYALPEHLALNLLGRRPDIISARLYVEAKQALIEQKKAAFYPNINLSALIGLQSLGLENLTQSGSYIGNVGPAIYLPIFSGGRLEADLKGAHAQYDGAIATYNSTVVHALQEVADIGMSQKSLQEQLKTVEATVEAAKEAYQVTHNRYMQGIANNIELLYASHQVCLVTLTQKSLKAKTLRLDIALKKALGGGYSDVSYKENKE